PRDTGNDLRAVDADVALVVDLCRQPERLAGADTVAIDGRNDLARHAVHEPAQHLAPERLVRHIVDGHVRVHLPEPRIVRCEDDGLPTPVALRCEDDVIAIVRFTGEQDTGSRLRPTDAVEDGEWREPLPDCGGGIGSTSARGVPAQPPSASARGPPSMSRLPPRTLTKSAIIRSWSCVKKLASTLPRMSAR